MIYPRLLILISAITLYTIPSRADQVQYLADPQQSLAAYLDLAGSARQSINIATFIFEPCHASTQILLETMAARARAGVRVRVLLDSLQQSAEQQQVLTDYFTLNHMEVRFYNRSEPNLRMHIKMMEVDGNAYITGGR